MAYYGTSGDDWQIDTEAHGGGGNDYLEASSFGDSTLFGDDGNDLLEGKFKNDKLYGGDGDDWIRGHLGNDYLSGGDGVDHVFGGIGDDFVKGGNGDDVLYGDQDEWLFPDLGPQAGNDILDGGAGADTMTGGAGRDFFIIEGGDVITDFVAGEDKIVFSLFGDRSDYVITQVAHGATVDSQILAGGNLVATVQNVALSYADIAS